MENGIEPVIEEKRDAEHRVMTADEYASLVRQWLADVYHWQCFQTLLPYYFLEQEELSRTGQATFRDWRPSEGASEAGASIPARASDTSAQGTPETSDNSSPQSLPRRGIEYGVPSMLRRFLAEVFDFFCLLVIKFLITYLAVDHFDFVDDVEKYNFSGLDTSLFKLNMDTALEVTSEVLLLELIHRVAVCFYEAFCTQRGTDGISGGATPGKMLMGLRVVSCEWVAPTAEDRAVVYPGGDLGFGRALLRAILKNLSLAFIFPLTFSMFFLQHNRTLYDVVAGSMVVERLNPNRERRQQ